MRTCIRCGIEGNDVVIHNGAPVHRAPGICFKKLRDVVISLQQRRDKLTSENARYKEIYESNSAAFIAIREALDIPIDEPVVPHVLTLRARVAELERVTVAVADA